MKAIICARYGPPEVLQLEEVEKPTPKDDQILIRIHAASVNPADFFKMDGGLERFMGAGFRKHKDPRIGIDFAGVVEAIGRGIAQFKPGDEVFGICPGSLAEYATAAEGRIALKPTNLSFEEAAAVPVAACTALQGLRDRGKIRSGQKVLVSGAGGGVGSFAVQLARSFGTEVTGVTRTENLDMVRSIGADHVVDYTKEDFTKSGGQYDLIYDVSSNHSVSALKRALSPGGSLRRRRLLELSTPDRAHRARPAEIDGRDKESRFSGDCEDEREGFDFLERAYRSWNGPTGHR